MVVVVVLELGWRRIIVFVKGSVFIKGFKVERSTRVRVGKRGRMFVFMGFL